MQLKCQNVNIHKILFLIVSKNWLKYNFREGEKKWSFPETYGIFYFLRDFAFLKCLTSQFVLLYMMELSAVFVASRAVKLVETRCFWIIRIYRVIYFAFRFDPIREAIHVAIRTYDVPGMCTMSIACMRAAFAHIHGSYITVQRAVN